MRAGTSHTHGVPIILFAAVEKEEVESGRGCGAAVVGGSDVIRLLKKQAGRGKGGRKTQSMDIRKVLHGQQVKGAEKSIFISLCTYCFSHFPSSSSRQDLIAKFSL